MLADKVERWIFDKQRQAVAVDVVNVVFECRRSKPGIHVGDIAIYNTLDFRRLNAGFKKGVRVNMISGGCNSGRLCETCRYWRARRQSAIWDVFELLIQTGFLKLECLSGPIALMEMTSETIVRRTYKLPLPMQPGLAMSHRDT